MILVFEMTWTGSVHAPGNSATIQTVALAWPKHCVRVHAESDHLAALKSDPNLTSLCNVEFAPIAVSDRWLGHTSIVTFRRGWQEWRTVRAALAQVPRGEPCLIFLISTTATGSFAASWAAAFAGRRVGLQVGFHGNLNDAFGWRSRNPVIRSFDTRSALEAQHTVPCRFLVLEDSIRAALSGSVPEAAKRVDVLPLPINTVEITATAGQTLQLPVRLGFVGFGTQAKGIDTFLSIAARVRRSYGDRAEFVHVGSVNPQANPSDYAALVQPPSKEDLPRDEFMSRLASLHYVFLPFCRGYYNLSASGALIDALTWLKPIICTRVPLTESFFNQYGDIGHLCDSEADLEGTVRDILANMDVGRYYRQVAKLREARATRHVSVLAQRYRQIVTEGFPGLLS